MRASQTSAAQETRRGRGRHRTAASGLLGLALVVSGLAGGQAQARAEGQSLDQAFTAASSRYGVPRPVLAAVSYAQTGWQTHTGSPSVAGGWGPMHLIDSSLLTGRGAPAPRPDTTLSQASRLTGSSPDQLRHDVAANVAGGAALLVAAQRELGNPVGADTDSGDWYAAAAALSGSSDQAAATDFADQVMAAVRGGRSASVDGRAVRLPASAASIDRAGLTALHLRPPTRSRTDCPVTLNCEWIPAPYQSLGEDPEDYGNHDLADRPRSPGIDHIVIHSTEETYDRSVQLATNPDYLAWNYTVRSSDGHIAQHLDPKDVGWQAGNWYMNMHSIGVEHEGYVAQGSWFTEPMYRSSAMLVRHLALEYRVPLDRAHIIGHDQVPALTGAGVAGMHNDPGPYWNWEHYFDLLGAPLRAGTTPLGHSDVVRMLPGFVGNSQVLTGCEGGCDSTRANFVYLRTAPEADAPLVKDAGIGAGSGTTGIEDVSARATAGVQYAVAERRGDWTAVWYLGRKAWFHNPSDHPTARGVIGAGWVTPRPDRASVPVYGGAYPEASAYPAGIDPQPQTPVTPYSIGAGQRYAVSDLHVTTDYYRAKTFSAETPDDHIDIKGHDRFIQISFGKRQYYVKASDVVVR